jgi:hypothetical protein
MLKGEAQIMRYLKVPWPVIRRLADNEGLPLVWVDGVPMLHIESWELWETARELRP